MSMQAALRRVRRHLSRVGSTGPDAEDASPLVYAQALADVAEELAQEPVTDCDVYQSPEVIEAARSLVRGHLRAEGFRNIVLRACADLAERQYMTRVWRRYDAIAEQWAIDAEADDD